MSHIIPIERDIAAFVAVKGKMLAAGCGVRLTAFSGGYGFIGVCRESLHNSGSRVLCHLEISRFSESLQRFALEAGSETRDGISIPWRTVGAGNGTASDEAMKALQSFGGRSKVSVGESSAPTARLAEARVCSLACTIRCRRATRSPVRTIGSEDGRRGTPLRALHSGARQSSRPPAWGGYQ